MGGPFASFACRHSGAPSGTLIRRQASRRAPWRRRDINRKVQSRGMTARQIHSWVAPFCHMLILVSSLTLTYYAYRFF